LPLAIYEPVVKLAISAESTAESLELR
jgi:hypothetical protein